MEAAGGKCDSGHRYYTTRSSKDLSMAAWYYAVDTECKSSSLRRNANFFFFRYANLRAAGFPLRYRFSAKKPSLSAGPDDGL